MTIEPRTDTPPCVRSFIGLMSDHVDIGAINAALLTAAPLDAGAQLSRIVRTGVVTPGVAVNFDVLNPPVIGGDVQASRA